MNEVKRVPQPRRPASGPSELTASREHVVVGVDGAPASVQALVWTLKYAADHDCIVEVVTAWPARTPVFVHEVPGHFAETRWKALEAQARTIAHATSLVATTPPYITRLENARAFDALVDAAQHGDLLVLGSDRADAREPFHGQRAGQVPLTVRVQREAPCPVLLIPYDPSDAVSRPKDRTAPRSRTFGHWAPAHPVS